MAGSSILDYDNVRVREDGYVCLTDMTEERGVDFWEWYRLDSTKTCLERLSFKLGIQPLDLVQVESGGKDEAWGHPRVGIRFNQWWYADYRRVCMEHRNYLTRMMSASLKSITPTCNEVGA